METFFLYIIKSTLCLALFYICFKALFSNDTFLRLNRWLLLCGTGICLLLPVIHTETKDISLIQQPILRLEKIITNEAARQDTFYEKGVEGTVPVVDSPGGIIFWINVTGIIYLIGCIVCLIISLASFRYMFRIIRSGRKEYYKNYTLILTPETISPFSWGNYIILSDEDFLNHRDEIVIHEEIHLASRHSIDLLFMEMIIILHWFNPAVWLLKRELKDIHEYQADRGVLNSGINATKYQLLLVKKAVGHSCYTLANSFNHSKIKKRITMMLKKKSNNWARLKLLLLVPAGVFILQAFAHPELVARPLETLNASALPASFSKSTTILQNGQKKKAEYYMVNNRRMTNEEYNDFVKNKVTRSSANMDELTNPAGKIIKAVSYQKTDKGNIPSSPIYLELKKGVKTEATNTVPPPPPPPPLGEVEVYYKDVAKPERIMINPGLAKSKHFLNNLNKVYTDKIVKVNVIAYSKDAKDKFKEDFEFADKMLKDKIKYQVEYSSEFKNE